jgi:predicted RNA-binding protein Jag
VRRIFPYAVSRNRLERGIRKLGFDARVVNDLREADVILTTKGQERRQPQRLRDAQARGKPLYVIKSNTVTQIEGFLLSVLEPPDRKELRQAALAEAERVIETALEEGQSVELSPQDRPLRRLQHELIHRHGLSSRSRGEEPFRRVVVFPP